MVRCVVHEVVREKLPEVVALCRSLPVRRLELFGSATGDAFDPEASDVDVLMEFDVPSSNYQEGFRYFRVYMDMKIGLEHIFDRSVDILSGTKWMRNPYFRDSVLESKELLYASSD
jgi:predicted nucleotidyltransferase